MTRRGSGRAAARASRSPGPNAHLPRNLVLAAFLATIVALVAFALNPHGRVWGFNHWAYWGRGFPALFAAGCVAMLAVAAKFWGIGGARATARSAATPTPAQAMAAQAMAVHASRLRTFLLLVAAGAAGALLFSLARARTHFLGDGYQSISLLATDPSAMRATAPLLKLVLPHVRPLFGQDAEAAALRTYQVLSIVSGVLFVLVVASFSRLLLSATRDRVLFTLSAVCGGFSLLFFGYVENYAPFIAFTAATFLAGIAVLEGRMQRIGLIIPALFMMSMHVFAALALPAVAFALFHASRLHFWARAHRLLAGNILLAAGAGAGIILFRWAQADPRIPVALLPLIPTLYTNEGYTLFSPKHL
ncbi:MAG TPA: hypothetical protein VFR10_12460, partial [bacterium]|nr:hypothetical protein [bacterium]